ncbi:MAG: heterodisulfide reductase-related iron-sulfur binding cluster [Pseudomonadota bacterium]
MIQPNSPIGIILVVGFAFVALLFFFSALYQRYRLVKIGREENRFDNIPRRIATLIPLVFGQWALLRSVRLSDRAGITHFFIFWGGIAFLFGYLFFVFGSAFSDGFALGVLGQGGTLLLSFVVDILGSLAFIAIIWGLIRRFVVRPERQTAGAAWLYFSITIAVLLLTYFVMEALRIVAGDGASVGQFPVGVPLAKALQWLKPNGDQILAWHNILWWLQFAVIIAFLIHSRYSEHMHAIAVPVNFFFRSLRPRGELKGISADMSTRFATPSIENLTWKELLDSLSCTECGRCQMACPAYLSGKMLNPKVVVQNIRKQLFKKNPSLLNEGPDRHEMLFDGTGEGLSEEAVWDCTTCGACQQQCPAGIEHVSLFVDLRRQLVERGNIGSSTRMALEGMFSLGNPWGQSQTARTDLARELKLPLIQEEEETVEFLYWIGCSSVYDERARKIVEAVSRLLYKADIRFAVLGAEEKCCGDPSRRIGEEGLFQRRALTNIEIFKKYKVRRILVHCPHCYHSLKHEYRQLGADLEVIHHSELILDLINRRKITLDKSLDWKLTVHDPCYLGRYNDLHGPVRQVIGAGRAVELVEMEKSREEGFCCGAGGGHLWMAGGKGSRMENMRLKQAQEVGAQVIVTACPYCAITLDSAASTEEAGRTKVRDIAELVMESV